MPFQLGPTLPWVRRILRQDERITEVNSDTPSGMVVEHAFLANQAQRARAVKLGVAITVQHALLYALGESLTKLWSSDIRRSLFTGASEKRAQPKARNSRASE